MKQHGNYVIDILLVEDNPADIRLTEEALKKWRTLNAIHVVRDGEAAVDFLQRQGSYRDAVSPDLILLDLNLPKMDGHEVLAEIKTDTDLKRIPIVILTSSESMQDILRSYNLHANCYVTKPMDVNEFMLAFQSIENFWLSVVKLPPKVEK